MAYGYGRPRRGFLAGRSGIMVGIVAMHVLAVVALSHARGREHTDPATTPVEVVFLEDLTEPSPPPTTPPKLLEAPLVETVLPVIDLPLAVAASTAITVAPPDTAPVPVPVNADIPVNVDFVDYLQPLATHYPPQAKRARAQGTVLVRVLIDPEGRPREVRVHRSSGHEQLDTAACESVRGALFKPHRENGMARSAQAIIPVTFALTVRTAKRQ